jgi:hypothetical protein
VLPEGQAVAGVFLQMAFLSSRYIIKYKRCGTWRGTSFTIVWLADTCVGFVQLVGGVLNRENVARGVAHLLQLFGLQMLAWASCNELELC